MTKATSLSDKTALRDEAVPRHIRQVGCARDGLREWRLQRLTAIAVIPLSLYFAASILSLATSDRKTAADWLSLPIPALIAILVVLAGIDRQQFAGRDRGLWRQSSSQAIACVFERADHAAA